MLTPLYLCANFERVVGLGASTLLPVVVADTVVAMLGGGRLFIVCCSHQGNLEGCWQVER